MCDHDRGPFVTLSQRFAHMARVRRDAAQALRRQGAEGGSTLNRRSGIVGLEAAANAYERCAEEIAAVLAGATPPAVGEPWPTDEKAAA